MVSRKAAEPACGGKVLYVAVLRAIPAKSTEKVIFEYQYHSFDDMVPQCLQGGHALKQGWGPDTSSSSSLSTPYFLAASGIQRYYRIK